MNWGISFVLCAGYVFLLICVIYVTASLVVPFNFAFILLFFQISVDLQKRIQFALWHRLQNGLLKREKIEKKFMKRNLLNGKSKNSRWYEVRMHCLLNFGALSFQLFFGSSLFAQRTNEENLKNKIIIMNLTIVYDTFGRNWEKPHWNKNQREKITKK